MNNVLVLNGPNLNLLGKREPDIYGSMSLDDLEKQCIENGQAIGLAVTCDQSNHEGDLVTAIQKAGQAGQWVVFNPGAYSHTSIALHDAIAGSNCKLIEVHISNIHAREEFRHHSFVSSQAKGTIVGLGTYGYKLALLTIAHYLGTL